MSDDILPQTQEQLEETAEDVTDALREFPKLVSELSGHLGKLVEHLSRLEPVKAVAQVPEAAVTTIEGTGQAAGKAAEAGGHVVAAAPAVATDVLETGSQAVAPVKRGIKYTLRKVR